MRLKSSVKESSGTRQLALSGALGVPQDLLSALFQSSTVGVSICDRQLRYRAVNDALASINGIPAAAHLGKTIYAVLGSAAAKVQPAFEHVFATGESLSNLELTAELPSRGATVHWNHSYFPIKNRAGQVRRVGALVLELTKEKELEAALLRLTDKLMLVSVSLRDHRAAQRSTSSSAFANVDDVFTCSALLQACLSEARAISRLLHAVPQLTALPPLEARPAAGTSFLPAGPEEDFVHAGLVECVSPLSAREREVAALLAEGKSNKQIGSMLTISTRTVESHRARIMLKLDMHSVTDLVRYAVRSNLIEP